MKFGLKRGYGRYDVLHRLLNVVSHSCLLLNTICFVYTTERGVRYWQVTSS